MTPRSPSSTRRIDTSTSRGSAGSTRRRRPQRGLTPSGPPWIASPACAPDSLPPPAGGFPVGGPTPPGGQTPRASSRATKERRTVKLVIGIVRPEKANDVLEALYRAEVRGVSLSRVQGHGGELERVETYRGTTVKMELAEKVRFEVAVSEAFVQPTIDALCEGGRTGEVGDGKIFVVPLERAVRIRTGETDQSAVTPVES